MGYHCRNQLSVLFKRENEERAMNQKVLFLILCIIFPLFISCSDMLSEYTGQGGGLPPSTGDVRITNDTGTSLKPTLVWTGKDYGAAWYDNRDGKFNIYFARISAAGVKQGQDNQITTDAEGLPDQSLVWTGNEYGITWDDSRDGGNYEIYFSHISSAGIKKDSDIRITKTTTNSIYQSLAWTGTEYGTAWQDYRNGNYEIYFTRISAAGVKQGSDVRVTNNSKESTYAAIVWTGKEYGVAWEDNRDGNYEIYFTRISAAGIKQGQDVRITNNAGGSEEPSLVWTGTEYGITWKDYGDGYFGIYFSRISPAGIKQGQDVRITDDSAVFSAHSSLFWTGMEYGVAWEDRRDGNYEIYFNRISSTGVKQGPDVRITNASESSEWPSLVWTGKEYGVAWEDNRDGNYEIYFARLYPDGTKK
jgi:hypothetical protein